MTRIKPKTTRRHGKNGIELSADESASGVEYLPSKSEPQRPEEVPDKVWAAALLWITEGNKVRPGLRVNTERFALRLWDTIQHSEMWHYFDRVKYKNKPCCLGPDYMWLILDKTIRKYWSKTTWEEATSAAQFEYLDEFELWMGECELDLVAAWYRQYGKKRPPQSFIFEPRKRKQKPERTDLDHVKIPPEVLEQFAREEEEYQRNLREHPHVTKEEFAEHVRQWRERNAARRSEQ